MNSQIKIGRRERIHPDIMLVFALIILTGSGLALLFSASYNRAEVLYNRPWYFFQRQAIWVALGIVAGLFASRIKLRYIRKLVSLAVILGIIGLLLTFVPGIGARYLGARRWIFIFGYSFQPSEAAKLIIILYLAHILACRRDQMNGPIGVLLPPMIIVAIYAALIYIQNDFSTAFFILFIACAMFFIAGAPWHRFIVLLTLGLPLAAILLLSQEHRVKRVISFLLPGSDPTGDSFQLLSAKGALANGNLWGRGIAQGEYKLGQLPEAQSDFVLAAIGEEIGYIGVLSILLLFILFAIRGIGVSMRTKGPFCSYLAFGITVTIVFQAIFNMAVVAGLIPTTGLPLPFFSAGGSSILVTLIMSGILLNVASHSSYDTV